MQTIERERRLTSNQKFMVFMLSMTIFGLADLVTQILPELSIGFIEIRVPYFAFIAITLAILFDPFTVAIGSAFGAVIFGGLLMGNFGGVGEIEGFLQLSVAIFLGGMAVSNPLNKVQVFIASCITVGFDKFVGGLVDVAKVLIGLEGLEPVSGLPESIFIIQGVEFLNDFILAGIIFGALPAMYLVPKLYGKIEPLLGMKPRKEMPKMEWSKILNVKVILVSIILGLISAGAAFLSEMDINIIEFELGFEELLGGNFIYVAIIISAVLLFGIWRYCTSKRKERTN
ncbi:cell division protein FtsQ [Clostridium butyricum]|uniref:cell division protein FtsQ n=1 Tax=Clostridium butyricum TaxID=1492 RepID=UPI0013D3BD44|nr:cell division protein FtsQ [Clostridium butyricum]MCQ2014773.1 cell division protein FtsQ [Clostridium butyricum]MCQ2019334.1 cell division protein FtsQ [Clostridium butyricum]MCQ2022972.1 cell division protein FtsQ [Clostridium butyricum]MCQ2027080.1 cell division protein FtsQ [Clostridium butyricum]MDB2157922.1 cell division protein FtsQ [Clostridium butyricum]